MIAHIPARILYVCRKPFNEKIGWEDFDDSRAVTVTPAYPVDADGSKKTIQNAIDWARGRYSHDGEAPDTMTVENVPLPYVQIVSLDIRGEGGRAYKVTVDGVYVDLREDVFLDAMLTNGVDVGGILRGPFIWARIDSQMKLIRVGSKLHDRVIAAHAQGAKKNVSTNEIEIGGIYRNRVGEVFVYLGQCNTSTAVKKHTWIEFTSHENVQGWIKIPKYSEPNQVGFDKVLEENHYFYFNTLKKRTVVECLGTVEVPENIWPRIRQMGRTAVKKEMSSDRFASDAQWRAYVKEREALGAAHALYVHGVDEKWLKNIPAIDDILEGDPK
jgi:hypothetical protein